ncbi:hypothetical protein F4803DRAFT_545779 [Xylaria telfairii]|nr:hypothetical protein F4803DRAFT_545779 [Xylaria telfairii]
MVPAQTSFTSINLTASITVQPPIVTPTDNLITCWLPPMTAGQPRVEFPGHINDIPNHKSRDAFLAFDPNYFQELRLDADNCFLTCLPTEARKWWQQENGMATASPRIEHICLEAYYTVKTSDTDESLKHVFCCPSEFFNRQYGALLLLTESLYPSQTWKHTFPSRCITPVLPGTFMYANPVRTWTTTVTTVKPDKTTPEFVSPIMMPTPSITTSTYTESISPQQPITTTKSFSPEPITTTESSEPEIPPTAPSCPTPSASDPSPNGNGGHARVSLSDRIALGVGIGVGLGVGIPSVILAFV